MLLKDIFEQLAQGELRHLAIGGVDSGGILQQDFNRVIPHINLGVTELCKRFPIQNKVLNVVATTSPYYDIAKLAGYKVLRVEKVGGQEAVMHDYNTVLYMTSGSSFEVIYRSAPAAITQWEQSDTTEVDLPAAYLEPLLFYIAMRMTAGQSTDQGQQSTSSEYQAKFEMSCMKLHEMGLTIDQSEPINRLQINGWV